MENITDALTLAGQVAQCPDCGDERLLVPVELGGAVDFCCTTCDAAVLVLDELAAVSRRTSPLAHRLAG